MGENGRFWVLHVERLRGETAVQMAYEDAATFVKNYSSGSGLAAGAQVMAGNIIGSGGSRPSDFL
ncbi:MAG: hypothetical protein KC423_29750, partial [Anaerolineales bacterium]|nr:hypothetical protein [Anaerolineales bacterium]